MSQNTIIQIMVIEDDPALQNVYKMILQSQGYKVTTAGDGMEALRVLRHCHVKPDLVLLDIFMPRMDGREFMKNLDKSEYEGMKIIVSSNLPDRDIMDEMLGLGADGYILKSSMSPNDLLELVDRTLA